jgi:hypothetical protein
MNQLGASASKGRRDELQSFSYDPNQVDEDRGSSPLQFASGKGAA